MTAAFIGGQRLRLQQRHAVLPQFGLPQFLEKRPRNRLTAVATAADFRNKELAGNARISLCNIAAVLGIDSSTVRAFLRTQSDVPQAEACPAATTPNILTLKSVQIEPGRTTVRFLYTKSGSGIRGEDYSSGRSLPITQGFTELRLHSFFSAN